MHMVAVEVPEDLLGLFEQSPSLGDRSLQEQLRLVLAMFLAHEEVISIGKAAELAGEPRIAFESLMGKLGFAVVHYDIEDYEMDLQSIALAKQRAEAS
jgi:predicted HTH domain antitoxin